MLRDLLPSGLYRRPWFYTRSTARREDETGRGLRLQHRMYVCTIPITAGRELHPAPKIAIICSVPRLQVGVKGLNTNVQVGER